MRNTDKSQELIADFSNALAKVTDERDAHKNTVEYQKTRIAELEATVAEKDSTMEYQKTRIAVLEATVAEKDSTIKLYLQSARVEKAGNEMLASTSSCNRAAMFGAATTKTTTAATDSADASQTPSAAPAA